MIGLVSVTKLVLIFLFYTFLPYKLFSGLMISNSFKLNVCFFLKCKLIFAWLLMLFRFLQEDVSHFFKGKLSINRCISVHGTNKLNPIEKIICINWLKV